MEWSHPAPRMREMILAIRAIWDTWQNGTPLAVPRRLLHAHADDAVLHARPASDLDGFGVPKIFLAGVGELMTEVAGEVCDGFLCHGFTTEKYLREVTLPALERGRAKAGKTMDGFEIVGPSFVVTGTERRGAGARRRPAPASRSPSTARRRRTGRCSTLHGWGGLQEELNSLSKQGEWVKMGDAHRRRDPQHVRRRRPARADRPRAAPPLRRRHRPHLVLRPVPAATPTAGRRSSTDIKAA